MEVKQAIGYGDIQYIQPAIFNTGAFGSSKSIESDMPDDCVFCGNEFSNIGFKGKCVCEECLCFVKELM